IGGRSAWTHVSCFASSVISPSSWKRWHVRGAQRPCARTTRTCALRLSHGKISFFVLRYFFLVTRRLPQSHFRLEGFRRRANAAFLLVIRAGSQPACRPATSSRGPRSSGLFLMVISDLRRWDHLCRVIFGCDRQCCARPQNGGTDQR